MISALHLVQDLEIDQWQHPIFDFVKALGYTEGDNIFFRALPPKGFTEDIYEEFPSLVFTKNDRPIARRLKLRMRNNRIWWLTSKGEKPVGSAVKFLTKLNNDGLGIYIVVNPGGHTEAEIHGSRVIFWEDDTRPKDEQLARFDECQDNWGGGFAIETKNSIHCYFRHDEFFNPIEFSINQLRVIREFGTDEAIWDAPRLMRVPGFDHTSIVDGVIARTPVRIVREWDEEITKWAWIDRILPAATEDDIDKATGTRSRSALTVPMGNDPCDPRTFIQLLPSYTRKSEDWATAAIPAPGVTSNDGFQVHLPSGGYKVWSGTVTSWEALQSIAIYLNGINPNITLQGILDWLRDNRETEEYQQEEQEGGQRPTTKQQKAELDAKNRDRLIQKRKLAFEQSHEFWQRSWELTGTEKRPLTKYDGSLANFGLSLTEAQTIGIRGSLGSGKTEALIRSIVEAARNDSSKLQIAIIAPTNGLCRQVEERIAKALRDAGLDLEVYHFQDDVLSGRLGLRDGHPGVYVMCKESFADYHVRQIDWENITVAIDEFSSFRQDAPSASKQMPELTRMLESCGHLIALDRFFSDVDAKVLSKYRGNDRVLFAQNEVKESKKIHFIESLTKRGFVSFSHNGVAISLLKKWQEEGCEIGRVAIASDSLLELKIIQQWMIDSGCKKNRLLISSETVEDAHRFMPNPDEEIEQQNLHYLLYSPTAQSGLDIQAQFDRGILICAGVLPPTLMIQMLGRCRKCNEWWVSAPRFSQDSALSFKMLDADVLKKWQRRIDGILTELGAAKGDRRTQAWVSINQALREFERKFNSECIQALLKEGYEEVDTVIVEPFKGFATLRDRVKDGDARKLLEADRVRGAEMLSKKRAPSTDTEIWDIKAAELFCKYPDFVGELRQAYLDWKTVKFPGAEQSIAGMGGIDVAKSTIAQLLDEEAELKEAAVITNDDSDTAQKRLNCEARKNELIEAVATIEMGDREFVDQMRIISSNKIERLYEGERARQNHERDRANILYAIRTQFTSAASKRFQVYRASEFFNRLELEGLVQGKSRDDWKESGLYVSGGTASSEISIRYEKFTADEELSAMFPEIDGIQGFWVVIKRILRGYGYQSSGGNVRQDVEGRHRNGSSRGKQRFTKTKSIYCVVFLRLECSGSKLFRELLPALMTAIRDRIDKEREKFKPKDVGASQAYQDRGRDVLAA